MTDRERLKEKIDYLQKVFMEDDDYDYFNEFLADKLLADKDVIVPPCKVGDMVYYVSFGSTIMEWVVSSIEITHNETVVHCEPVFFLADDFGKTVFLTKKEAEKALKEREQNDR